MPIRLTNSNAKCLVFKVFLLIITIIVIVDVFLSLVSRNDLVEIKKKRKDAIELFNTYIYISFI